VGPRIHPQEGMILWIVLVSVGSVVLQTVFFVGILFNRFVGKENTMLLAIITVLVYQSYLSTNSLPVQICSRVTFSTKLFVTWKTRNGYGAYLIAVTINMVEIAFQVL
jgi:hypothetical protein